MTSLNKDAGTIYRLLINSGFSERVAMWGTAQSAHETDNFTSPIYRNNLNAFGMTYVGQKEARGEKNGYAWYESQPDSIKDYKRLFKIYGFGPWSTVESFVNMLKEKKYFEAPTAEYLKGVRYFIDLYFINGKLKKELIPAGAGGTW